MHRQRDRPRDRETETEADRDRDGDRDREGQRGTETARARETERQTDKRGGEQSYADLTRGLAKLFRLYTSVAVSSSSSTVSTFC